MKIRVFGITFLASLAAILAGPGPAVSTESAWEAMVRADPAVAEDGQLTREERQILQLLTPEQAERFAAGEDPSTIILADGTDLGTVLAAGLDGPGSVYFPIDTCRLKGPGVPSDDAYPEGETIITTRGTCGIPQEATAVLLNLKVRATQAGRVGLYPVAGAVFPWGFINFEDRQITNNAVVVELCQTGCDAGDLVVRLDSSPQVVRIHALGYFAPRLDEDSLAALSCAPGEVPSWNGQAWGCARDEDSLAALRCPAGWILKYDGGWTCAPDLDSGGDVTAVHPMPGGGLVGGGHYGSVLLGTDPGIVQRPIDGACPEGQGIRAVHEDGGIVCTELPVPLPAADTGWLPAPMGNQVTLSLDTPEPEFVVGMARGSHPSAGDVMMPIMGAVHPDYMPAYVRLSGDSASIVGPSCLADVFGFGEVEGFTLYGGEVRLRAFSRAADYDSRWRPCVAGSSYVFSHELGSLPTFALVEISGKQKRDGTGWRVPTMAAANHDGDGWRQTAIVALDETTVTLRTQGALAHFVQDAQGTAVAPTGGFCRVRLFDWEADYDSGWVGISTEAGEQKRWFQHGLDQVPSLVMLWLAQHPGTGRGWMLPAMGGYQHEREQGTSLYGLTERWAVVQAGPGSLGQFIDASGYHRRPPAGSVRFLAWK